MKAPDQVFHIWRAYFCVEPWPEERAELLNALLAQSIHADFSGQVLPLDNWLPKFDMTREQREKAEQDASLAALMAIAVEGD